MFQLSVSMFGQVEAITTQVTNRIEVMVYVADSSCELVNRSNRAHVVPLVSERCVHPGHQSELAPRRRKGRSQLEETEGRI